MVHFPGQCFNMKNLLLWEIQAVTFSDSCLSLAKTSICSPISIFPFFYSSRSSVSGTWLPGKETPFPVGELSYHALNNRTREMVETTSRRYPSPFPFSSCSLKLDQHLGPWGNSENRTPSLQCRAQKYKEPMSPNTVELHINPRLATSWLWSEKYLCVVAIEHRGHLTNTLSYSESIHPHIHLHIYTRI